MKARLFIATLLLSILYSAASAQSYQIRVTHNTNLRALYSLDSAVLASAPAGTTLHVVGQLNRWLQISRDGREFWMANWVSYTRVEPTAPTQTQPGANIDNCCFVDRQCQTDHDWTGGYWAFQQNECAANPPSSAQQPTQPHTSAPANVDNCCYLGWDCQTDEQWRNGYNAHKNHQCAGPSHSPSTPQQIPAGVDNCCYVNQQCANEEDWKRGWAAYKHFQCRTDVPVAIVGGAGFRDQIMESFLMLQRTAPYWYEYTIRGLNQVVQTGSYEDTYVDVFTKTFYLHYSDIWPAAYSRHEHIVFTASILVHEACHVHRQEAGLESGGLAGETACTQRQLEAHVAMDPQDPRTDEHRETLATIHDPSTWWW